MMEFKLNPLIIGVGLVFVLTTCFSIGKNSFLYKNGENTEFYSKEKQDAELDKNQAVLDSLIWLQMMEEAERVTPWVGKSYYNDKKNPNSNNQGKGNSGKNNNSEKGSSNSSTEELGTQSISAMSTIPSQAEYDALMDFYQAMGGPNWFNNTGWSSANPNVVQDVSGFHGITLDDNGHVKWIIFWQNNLNGTIPESFGDLTYLEHIQIVRSPFIGQLPQSIGNLNKVKELLLYGNHMTGTLPNTIGNMTALENVHLYMNNLSGSIPMTLTNLPNLKFFSIYDNYITGTIPSNMGNLTQMTHFYINGNAVSGTIPVSMGNMISIKELYLYSNQLSGTIPSSLGNLSNLTRLYLSNNQLTGSIPSSIGNLSNLQFFWSQYNYLSGSIPSEIGNLQSLDSFLAYNNSITGTLPSSLGNMPSLRQLRLHENQISGTIPSSYGNLTNINSITLDNNKLTGSIPTTFCSFSNITQLTLNDNFLEGDIPNCLFDKNMTEFTVRYNYYNFENLTYAKTKVNDYIFYAPQFLKFVDTVYIAPNMSSTLEVDDGNYQGSPSLYRWRKDGTWLHSASSSNEILSVSCPTSSCEGLYYLQITNPDFSGPHLSGDVFYVKVGVNLNRTVCQLDTGCLIGECFTVDYLNNNILN